MELQALLVLCGLGVAGAAVLLLMGLFSSSGTSYEEAMAQQRKATSELLALAEGKSKPKKNAKKANKKLAKKEKHKDSLSAATGSEPESEAPADSGADDDTPPQKPHVEFRPPVVVDIPRDAPPNVKIRKRGKDPKVKPILINKEDPSCVSEASAPPSPAAGAVANRFEEIHPKDELELMLSSFANEKTPEKKEEVVEKKEQQASKGTKQAKGKQSKAATTTPISSVPAPAAEQIKEEPAVRERHNSVEQPKEQRKGKKDKKPQTEEAPREEPVPPLNALQPSELTTDKLLRQALATVPTPSHQPTPVPTPPPKSKKKKQEPNLLALIAAEGGGVNVAELVRLVREASLSRTEIQILTDALLNKHHDPLPQHSEWTEGPNDPMQKLKRQLADKEKALADETEASQALHAKLKELRSALNAERSRAAGASRAAEEAAAELTSLQARLQRAADDNHALAQDKLMLQSKLSAEGEAQAQRVQMEVHIQRMSESEAALMGQLQILQGEAAARAHEVAQARCEAAAARDAALLAQQHAADLAQQLQEANRVCSELDAQRQSALLAEQAAAQERFAGLSELQNEVQRLKARVQAAEAAAAAANANAAAANAEKLREEAEKQTILRNKEVGSLREQLSARDAELAEAKALRAAPAHNGLAAATDLKSAELGKVEGVVTALRAELAAATRGAAEQRTQLAKLQEQLSAYQDKNNELRTKNWKVMEALQTAEKALQSKSNALPAQDSLRDALLSAEAAQYKEVASILGAACPSAAPSTAPGRPWLEAFASALRAQLNAKATAPTASTAPTAPAANELKAQNEHLQGLVDKYKRIIDDTEGVLSRLQQNVTAEERRWAEQLSAKQRELDELRMRTVTQMQSKIDTLEAELRKSKNRFNIFTDEERNAEDRSLAERSLADLSKNKLDSLNGPLQVGVEEK